MIAITKTTTTWRAIADASQLTANEVAFSGDFLFAADGRTPLMVWDATLDAGVGNVRAMTASEIAALPAQQQAARDAREPDLATFRDQAAAAVTANNTFVAITAPSNAQNAAQIKELTRQNSRIIKALLRLVLPAI